MKYEVVVVVQVGVAKVAHMEASTLSLADASRPRSPASLGGWRCRTARSVAALPEANANGAARITSSNRSSRSDAVAALVLDHDGTRAGVLP
jgi:hypothetical protein